MPDPKIAIIDIETTGLDPLKNVIVEVGILLLDKSLEALAHYSHVCTDDNTWAHLMESKRTHDDGSDDFIWKMHSKNGLISEIDNLRNSAFAKRDQTWVADSLATELAQHNMGGGHLMLPMTGSSVHFDRKFIEIQMPALAKKFSHRCIDVSTIKELTKLYRPDVVTEVGALSPEGKHRSLNDCWDTRGELKVYLEHVFNIGGLIAS